MGPVLRYVLWRVALFVAAGAVLYLLGARGVLLVALAAVVSLPLSILLLGEQRDAMSRAVAERVARRTGAPSGGRRRRRPDPDADAEDTEDDRGRDQRPG